MKTRNDSKVDFSRAGNRKQLLITGFDSFVFNEDPKAPNSVNYGNSLQSNPSGVTVLALHGLNIGHYHIQRTHTDVNIILTKHKETQSNISTKNLDFLLNRGFPFNVNSN